MRWFWMLCLLGCSDSLISPHLNQIDGPSDDVADFDPYSTGEGIPEELLLCDEVTIETESQIRPVDILWAIDTSPSMSGEKKMVQNNLNKFSQHLDDAGIDANVVLIATASNEGGICISAPLGSGNCPNDHNPPHLFRDYRWVGSHNALDRFISQWSGYASVIRPNSMKYYAVVTDDDAQMNAHEFTTQRDSLDPAGADYWTFFGLFCAHRDSGGVYQTLVTQTGGLHVELCRANPDWQDVFDQMVTTVIENRSLDCEIPIPDAPPAYPFEANKLNVDYRPGDGSAKSRFYHVNSSTDCGAAGGWYYDDNANPTQIHLCDASCETVDGDFDGELDVWFIYLLNDL